MKPTYRSFTVALALSWSGLSFAQTAAPVVASPTTTSATTGATSGGAAAPNAAPGDACAPNAQPVAPGGKAATSGTGNVDDGAPCATFWVRDRGWTTEKPTRPDVSLGDYVIVQTNEPLPTLIASQTNGRKLGLYINDLFFKDITPMPVPERPRAAMFHLVRTDENRDLWSVLFTRKGLGGNARNTCDMDPRDGIFLSVGYGDGVAVAPQNSACLEYFPKPWFAAFLAALCFAFIAFTIWKSRTTSMIRDVGIPPSGSLGPYSLARFQMALWFVTVICAILFCYAVTGDLSPIPQGTLILMGIGAGTAVSSGAIDVNALPGSFTAYRQLRKVAAQSRARVQQMSAALAAQPLLATAPADMVAAAALDPRRAELHGAQAGLDQLTNQVAAYEVPASKGFFVDVLSDGNGVAFHRVQVLIWTMVYWIIFIVTLVHTISLKDFDPTALALMGISGATYLGFKLQQPAKTGDKIDG